MCAASQLRREGHKIRCAYSSPRDDESTTQPLMAACCLTEGAQPPPTGGCPPQVLCRRLHRRLDLRACIPWLDRSTGADHRSRAFQITPSVALSLSLSPARSARCSVMLAAHVPVDACHATCACCLRPICCRCCAVKALCCREIFSYWLHGQQHGHQGLAPRVDQPANDAFLA